MFFGVNGPAEGCLLCKICIFATNEYNSYSTGSSLLFSGDLFIINSDSP